MYKIVNRKKRLATMAADALGKAVFSPARLLRFGAAGALRPSEVRSILVIRTAYIGDVIMTMPMLKPLRRRFPAARITFLACSGAEGVLASSPYVDEFVPYDAFWFYNTRKAAGAYLAVLRKLRARRFDLVIEARADIRDIALLAWPARALRRVSYGVGGGAYMLTDVVPFGPVKHKVDYHLDIARHMGCEAAELDWGLSLTRKECKDTHAMLAREGVADAEPVIGIHPGGRKDLKSWLPERYAEVADSLSGEYGARVVFTGSPGEKRLIEGIVSRMRGPAVNLGGRTSLRSLACVIKRCALFITNDSAPLHLASALGTPTVAVFGPSKSNETGPYGNAHRVVEKDFPCRLNCDEDKCLHSRFKECMEAISAKDVLAAARELFDECRKRTGLVQA